MSREAAPPPEGFRNRFIQDGWRGIENYYGARTSVNRKWIALCGGQELREARNNFLKERKQS